MSKTTKPLWEMRAGKFKISAWQHNINNKSKEPSRLSFTLQRSYKNKNDKWVNETITLFPDDLPYLEDVTQATRQRAVVKYTEIAPFSEQP
jgi:hypothetical protein